MFLNEAFMQVLEELDSLTEAKADTQRLIDFAGEDLANRFLAIKDRLKSPENDLYYWIKNKTVEELEAAVLEIENTKSKSQMKKDIADQGAELVCDSAHWKIYHITTFEASQKYGRDSQWCITGVNDYGDRYWKQYTEQGVSFYFLITKSNYDPRGCDSKFALAVYSNNMAEVYNQQDDRVSFYDIPYCNEVEIPGLDVDELNWEDEDEYNDEYYYCEVCDCELDEDEVVWGPGSEGAFCNDCWAERFFVCDDCGEAYDLDDASTNVFGEVLCSDCYDSFLDSSRGAAQAFYYWSEDGIENFVGKITTENKKEIEKELHELATSWFKAKYSKQLDFTEAELEDIENAIFEDATELGLSFKKEDYTKYDYRYLDDPTDTGYAIGVDGSNKEARNHGVNVEEALEEILTFINSLSAEEKPKVSLSWRCASSGYNPDNKDFMDGYEGELIVSIYSDEEQKHGYFESEEERIQEKTCANYDYAENKIRAALGLPKRVYESLNGSFYKSFKEYETLWDEDVTEQRYKVIMVVDDEEYTYGTYDSRNRANEVAIKVRDERGVDTFVEISDSNNRPEGLNESLVGDDYKGYSILIDYDIFSSEEETITLNWKIYDKDGNYIDTVAGLRNAKSYVDELTISQEIKEFLKDCVDGTQDGGGQHYFILSHYATEYLNCDEEIITKVALDNGYQVYNYKDECCIIAHPKCHIEDIFEYFEPDETTVEDFSKYLIKVTSINESKSIKEARKIY